MYFCILSKILSDSVEKSQIFNTPPEFTAFRKGKKFECLAVLIQCTSMTNGQYCDSICNVYIALQSKKLIRSKNVKCNNVK